MDITARFDHVLADADEQTRARVKNAVAIWMQSGWEPTDEDVRMLLRIDRGEASEEEKQRWIFAP